jgi:hypothetical protein
MLSEHLVCSSNILHIVMKIDVYIWVGRIGGAGVGRATQTVVTYSSAFKIRLPTRLLDTVLGFP